MKDHRIKITGSIIKIVIVLFFNSLIIAQDSTYLTPIIPDFQVNENVMAAQYNPSVAMDPDGNYVIVWVAEKNIYGQRYSNSVTAIEENFVVNDSTVEHTWPQPKISINDTGTFMITWASAGNIYAQLYSNNGTPIGKNFQVNSNSNDCGDPSISSDGEGNFIIFWSKYFGGSGYKVETFAQWFASEGNYLGDNFILNIDKKTVNPSFSVDGDGNIVGTWINYHGVNIADTLYFQRFSKSGTSIGNSFIVIIGNISGHTISVDEHGNFVIAWCNAINNDIYAQIFSSEGTTIADNLKVNSRGNARYPSVSIDGKGNFIITWSEWIELSENSLANIYAQRYLSDGTEVGDNFLINSQTEHEFSWYLSKPYISSDDRGSFVITWMGIRDEDPDIFARLYSSDGIALANNFIVNDDIRKSIQRRSSIDLDENGNFTIVWADSRNDNGEVFGGSYDIYVQRFSNSGDPIGNNFRVNDSLYYSGDKKPAITIDGLGNSIIVWESNSSIYAQILNSSYETIGNNFLVTDQEGIVAWWTGSHCVDISSDAKGNFVIVWEDSRNINSNFSCNIYAQRYSNNGLPLGSNFKVNDSEEIDSLGWKTPSPSIASHANGNFVIIWSEVGGIYAQQYSSDGSRLGGNFWAAYGTNSDISVNGNGNYILAWGEIGNGIYAQRYSSDGSVLGNIFKVNNDSVSSSQYCPSISSDMNGNFVIAWGDGDIRTDITNIYAQRYSMDGTPIGKNFKISGSGSSPDVKLWNGKIYSTWSESRGNGTGIDIWANVLDGDFPPPTDVDENQPIPASFSLAQNYPNPFNPSTKIKYSIPSSSVMLNSFQHLNNSEIPNQVRDDNVNVVLRVYDILGRELATLVNQKQKPGNYEVVWDANNQPSGVYFYQLTAGASTGLSADKAGSATGFVETKKMILLR